MHVVCFGIKSLNIKRKKKTVYKKTCFLHFIYLSVFIYLFCTFKEKRQGGLCGSMDQRLTFKLVCHQVITKNNSFLKVCYYAHMLQKAISQ